MTRAILRERGHGFPVVGEYVMGEHLVGLTTEVTLAC